MNPHGKVPVIQDGSVVVWESNSIVRYLCASYGVGSLWQNSPEVRSQADRWIDWSATTLQPSCMKLFWGHYRTPADRRNYQEIKAARAACLKCYRALNEYLSNQNYLAGDRFSMADIPAGTSLYRYFTMGVDVEQPREVMAWYARLRDRPAFQKHIMVPFDKLFARLAFVGRCDRSCAIRTIHKPISGRKRLERHEKILLAFGYDLPSTCAADAAHRKRLIQL
jgi:glutathione S-transferase